MIWRNIATPKSGGRLVIFGFPNLETSAMICTSSLQAQFQMDFYSCLLFFLFYIGDSRKYRTSLPIVSGRSTCVRGSIFSFRFAVPGESFGLTLFLRFSDRCRNPAMPSSATGSGIARSRARQRLHWSARLQVSAIARKSTFHLAPKHCAAHILFL